MDEETLGMMGLSKNEAKIFIALTQLGPSTAAEVAKKAGLHRVNTYDALQELLARGLASYFIKNDVKYFEAAEPETLMGILKDKEAAVQRLVNKLSAARLMAKTKSDVHIYEGIQAFRRVFSNMLNYNDTILTYGVPRHAAKTIGESFVARWHSQRIAKKIVMKHIVNEDYDPERIKFLKSLPYTELKFLPKKYNSPAASWVCGDEITFSLWVEPVLVIQIKNAQIANVYKNYFYLLYKMASKKLARYNHSGRTAIPYTA